MNKVLNITNFQCKNGKHALVGVPLDGSKDVCGVCEPPRTIFEVRRQRRLLLVGLVLVSAAITVGGVLLAVGR